MTSAAVRWPKVAAELRRIAGNDAVLEDPQERLPYECDGFVVRKKAPDLVVFPRNRDQVVSIVKLCRDRNLPFVPRGAGTSLAGGCLPVGGGIMIGLSRMKAIREIRLQEELAIVEPGVVNLELSRALQGSGYHYAPDPSSQAACTLGGNVATNSGGPHTLKYGVTVHHVLGLEMVLPDASILRCGGPNGPPAGIDLTALLVGSEGTLGIVTEVCVKLTPDPETIRTLLAVFPTVDTATQAISSIIAAGIIPAALEMMDRGILQAVEAAYQFGFPLDAGAVVLIELDGNQEEVLEQAQSCQELCRRFQAREIRQAEDEAERALLWKCRKKAFGAVGRLAPSYCTQDGVVPRTKLPEILQFIRQCEATHGLRIVNVFHAGDGNIHPLLLFDERDPDQVKRALRAGDEILAKCLELGGSVSGEHGIGVEKTAFMDKMFSPESLQIFKEVREVFNPNNLCNPGKMLPVAGGCSQEFIPRSHPGRRAPV
ncbi:MAG: FAD-binding protein [Planctomycetota bacterium]|nr:MAG: FAD-binding protein [Planctomycetota bacterium]